MHLACFDEPKSGETNGLSVISNYQKLGATGEGIPEVIKVIIFFQHVVDLGLGDNT